MADGVARPPDRFCSRGGNHGMLLCVSPSYGLMNIIRLFVSPVERHMVAQRKAPPWTGMEDWGDHRVPLNSSWRPHPGNTESP